MKNNGTSMAEALIHVVVPSASNGRLNISYGGVIKNNIWQQANTPLLDGYNVSLNFDLNQGKDNTASFESDKDKVITKKLLAGSNSVRIDITVNNPKRKNCEFLGWSKSQTAQEPTYTKGNYIDIEANTTLYAVWKYNGSKVYFYNEEEDMENGNFVAEYDITKELHSTLNQNAFLITKIPSDPIKIGYEFAGWKICGTNEIIRNGGVHVNTTNDINCIAQWKKVTYTVSFNSNGGNFDNSLKVNAGENLKEFPTDPTKDGYVFDGWYDSSDSGNKVTVPMVINNDFTFYAHWLEAEASLNGVNYTKLVDAISDATSGSTVTLLKNIEMTDTLDINKNIILDFDGNEFKNSTDNVGIIIRNSITLKNGTITKEGSNYGIRIYGNGNVNFENMKIVGYTPGQENVNYTILLSGYNGKLVLRNTNVTANKCAVVSIGNTAKPTVVIESGELLAKKDRAIYLGAGTLIIGKDDGNVSKDSPSIVSEDDNIYFENNGNYVHFEMYDGSIEGKNGMTKEPDKVANGYYLVTQGSSKYFLNRK